MYLSRLTSTLDTLFCNSQLIPINTNKMKKKKQNKIYPSLELSDSFSVKLNNNSQYSTVPTQMIAEA